MRSLRTAITALTAVVVLGVGAGAAAAAPLAAPLTSTDQATGVVPAPFSLTVAAATTPVAKAGLDLPVTITAASGCAASGLPGSCTAIDVTLRYQHLSSGQWGSTSGRLPGAGGTLVLTIPAADVHVMGLSYTATATQSCGATTASASSAGSGTGIVLIPA